MYKDSIDNILRDRPLTIGEMSWSQKAGRHHMTAVWGWLLTVFGAMFLPLGIFMVIGFSQLTETEHVANEDAQAMMVGSVLFGSSFLFFGAKLRRASSTAMAQQDEERRWDIEFSRKMSELSMNQRLGVIETLSKIEIEHFRSQGLFNSQELAHLRQEQQINLTAAEEQRVREWEADEAKKVREHEASESSKDRKQSTKELLTKYKHELKVLEKRVRSAPDVTKDELTAFELEKAAMDAIDKEEDEDKKERMIRRLDKRLYR